MCSKMDVPDNEVGYFLLPPHQFLRFLHYFPINKILSCFPKIDSSQWQTFIEIKKRLSRCFPQMNLIRRRFLTMNTEKNKNRRHQISGLNRCKTAEFVSDDQQKSIITGTSSMFPLLDSLSPLSLSILC